MNGNFYLISISDNLADYLRAMGVPEQRVNELVRKLNLPGPNGQTKDYMVDLENRCMHCKTYVEGTLIRELTTALDTETEVTSLAGGPARVVMSSDGLNRLIRQETGDNYKVKIVGEVTDDICNLAFRPNFTSVKTCTAGDVVMTMKFKKYQP